MRSILPVAAARSMLSRVAKTLKTVTLSPTRRVLLTGAAIILIGGIGACYAWQHDTPAKNTDAKTAARPEPKKIASEVLDSTNSAPETQNTPTPPAPAAPPPTPTPRASAKKPGASSAEIIASIPRTTFRIGEDSGTITLSMSDNTPVVWSILPQYPSTIYLADRNFAVSPTTTFTVKTNMPPSAFPGTYTVAVEAYLAGSPKSKVGVKLLSFTILPQEAIRIDVLDENMEFYDDGSACTYYKIVEQVHGVILGNVIVSASIVGGDPTGLAVSVSQPLTSPYICIQLAPDAPLGERTIRATATYNGYTTSDDFLVDVVAVTE